MPGTLPCVVLHLPPEGNKLRRKWHYRYRKWCFSLAQDAMGLNCLATPRTFHMTPVVAVTDRAFSRIFDFNFHMEILSAVTGC